MKENKNIYKPLLNLARETIKAKLNKEQVVATEDIKENFNKKQACFVTLTEEGELRGCIGSIEAHQELWKDVIDNSINAAFGDPRFEALEEGELPKIKIEISILSVPQKLEFINSEDLLKKIDNKMGIILRKGYYGATFLPQVWEEIPEKIEFLEHLSRKAGLSKDDWKTAGYRFYRVESCKE
ncbi:MAG: AmmeMemoRadiSam system protein A [Nanoarchaeota archaeon]|nr:AmmeMemoRadiSam system protein A [Nanoarchaeota archaeon]